jgi:hypothetical protein
MNWLLWTGIGTGVWLLAKKPEGAVLVPKPSTPAPSTPVLTPSPTTPVTIDRVVITNGRKYIVTRAGLGIYRVELAKDPTVFQLITQNGVLQEKGDPQKLAQLRADEAQFPANLFA